MEEQVHCVGGPLDGQVLDSERAWGGEFEVDGGRYRGWKFGNAVEGWEVTIALWQGLPRSVGEAAAKRIAAARNEPPA